MSNVNNQFKELINEAIHNHFHDKTETEMILKDWLYGICEQLDEYEAKAKAFDGVKELINAHGCAIEEESGLGHLFLLDLKSIMKYTESGESQ